MTPSHEQSPSTYFFFFVYVCLNNLETFVELVGARPLHLACARPFCCSKAPLGLSLLRCASQTRSMRFERSGKGQELSRGHKFSILENFLSIRDFTSQTPASFPSDLVGVRLPQTLPDKSKEALSAPMLFLSLLLFQFKLTLLFCFALFTAKCFSHQLVFFSLHLQRLL